MNHDPINARSLVAWTPVSPRRTVAKCLFLALACTVGWAAPAQTLLLSNAVVHTVSGPTLSPGLVLIQGEKIAAVGTNLAAAGAQVIDLGGALVYPGMIALNNALGLTEISAVRATRDASEVGDFTPEVFSWIAVNPDSELIPVARANGVSHTQPVPTGGVVAGHSGLVKLNGWTIEDLAVKKLAALHLYWPDLSLNTTPKELARNKARWKSLEDQDKDHRTELKAIDDFFDEAHAYAKAREQSSASDVKLTSIIPAWEAMLPFVRGEIPLMIHADEERQIRSAVEWATARRYKMILAGGREAARVWSLLGHHNVPVVYDHVFTLPDRATDQYDVQFTTPARLSQAGVKVAFSPGPGGSGSGATLAKNLPYAAAQAVAHGLPRDEAIKGLTLYPAQFLNVADRLGSIEPGKEATLFATHGDLLDIRANVQRMWIAGKEVSLENRHTRLYQKYRNRPKAR